MAWLLVVALLSRWGMPRPGTPPAPPPASTTVPTSPPAPAPAPQPSQPEGDLSAVAQLVRGLGTEGIGRWRRYHRQLEPVAALLEPWVKRFYYDP